MNVGSIVTHFAKRHPDKAAIHFLEKTITYGELNHRSNQLANKLQSLGFRKNDKLALLLRNCSEYIEIFFALAKIGVVCVPVNFRLVEQEIDFILKDCDAKGVILDDDLADKIAPLIEDLPIARDHYFVIGSRVPSGLSAYADLFAGARSEEPSVPIHADDCLVIGYTSGTTGRPKGAICSHRSKIMDALAQAAEFKIHGDDIHLVAAPLCHSGGMFMSLARCFVGGTLCIMRQFDAEEALHLIDRKRITTTFMVPTMLNFLLELPQAVKSKYDIASLRVIDSTGSPLPTRTKEGILDFFPGVQLFEQYAATEFGLGSLLKPADQLRKIRCVGQPFWGVEIRLLDQNHAPVAVGAVGEIFVRSPYLMDGYHRLGRTGFVDDWFGSGDLARQDEENYLYIVDRRTDMIISGAENIYPAEIEDVLYSHPKVLEAAVIGIPDETWGESVRAVIALKRGCSCSRDEIIDYCRTRLAGFKIPKSIVFTPELPKNTSGKILKRVIRDEYWQGSRIKV